MTSHEKKRLGDLEKRVKELEARPVIYPTIVILQPVPAAAPAYPQWVPNVPFYAPPLGPTWTAQQFPALGTVTC